MEVTDTPGCYVWALLADSSSLFMAGSVSFMHRNVKSLDILFLTSSPALVHLGPMDVLGKRSKSVHGGMFRVYPSEAVLLPPLGKTTPIS